MMNKEPDALAQKPSHSQELHSGYTVNNRRHHFAPTRETHLRQMLPPEQQIEKGERERNDERATNCNLNMLNKVGEGEGGMLLSRDGGFACD